MRTVKCGGLSLHALFSCKTFEFLPHRVNTSLLKKPMCYTFKYASHSLGVGNPITSVKRNTIPVRWCSFISEGLNANHNVRVDELATFPIKRSFYIARYSFYNIMSQKKYTNTDLIWKQFLMYVIQIFLNILV